MTYFKPKDNYFEITQAFLAFCKIISEDEKFSFDPAQHDPSCRFLICF